MLYALHICLLALGMQIANPVYIFVPTTINKLITDAYGIWTFSIEQELGGIAWTLWKDKLNQEFCSDNEPFMIVLRVLSLIV
jgi:hypothetical protein